MIDRSRVETSPLVRGAEQKYSARATLRDWRTIDRFMSFRFLSSLYKEKMWFRVLSAVRSQSFSQALRSSEVLWKFSSMCEKLSSMMRMSSRFIINIESLFSFSTAGRGWEGGTGFRLLNRRDGVVFREFDLEMTPRGFRYIWRNDILNIERLFEHWQMRTLHLLAIG